jgi:5-methylcytosine-specific restriction protein A
MSEWVPKPNWTRDELILALDLYFKEPSARGNEQHPGVIQLSEVLRSLPIHPGAAEDPAFRNPNGVGMKLSNFMRFDPNHPSQGLKAGSKLEEEVWVAFSLDRQHLSDTARAIVENAGEARNAGPFEDDEGEGSEGKILTRKHLVRERSGSLPKKKKSQVLKKTGKLECEACGFDFRKHYGEHGEGFAECHHLVPVSELRPGTKTRLRDLAILCANCHRMIHRSRPWLSLEQLKELIQVALPNKPLQRTSR